MDSPHGRHADAGLAMLAMWECAAIWSRASMEAFARMWAMPSSRGDSLATLGLAMDRHMRSPAFLRLMQHSLRMANARSFIDLTHVLLGAPRSLLKGRVSS